jgi:hypothetical protein
VTIRNDDPGRNESESGATQSEMTAPAIRMKDLLPLVEAGNETAILAVPFASDPKPRPKAKGRPYYPYGVSIRERYIGH